MIVRFLRPFLKDYAKLNPIQQKKVQRQLKLLAENVSHLGLNARKMTGTKDIWEARIDYQYRMTFRIEGEIIVMRRLGTHAIYRKP